MTRCDRDGARRVIRPVGRSRADILAALADKEASMLDNAKKSLSGQADVLLTQYTPGDRVELAPHTVAWLSGDRFGTVTAVGRFYVHVRTDLGGGKERRIAPENIARKVEAA